MVPLRRGFSKPVYQTQAVSAALITEEEVATFLSNSKYLVSKVSHYLEKILNQDFRVNVQPGTAIFSLDATDRKTGIATELVNEGFGVNQMVYFLAKALNTDTEWTCIEEPEIHLHPSAVRSFARALGEMVNIESKNFVVSTHSEAFVLALLSLIAEGKLRSKQVAFYFVQKEGKRAIFERQVVHDNGQIEGGLTSFMGGEVEDLKSLLKGQGVGR
jgi:predicted ATPase